MNQDTLASAAGVTRASLANIESGRQRVQLHTLLRIAETFGLPVATFLSAETFLADAPGAAPELPAHLSPEARSSIIAMIAAATSNGASR
jgi:transcriptional regulator with XRE-family HTH domain